MPITECKIRRQEAGEYYAAYLFAHSRIMARLAGDDEGFDSLRLSSVADYLYARHEAALDSIYN